MTSSGDTDRLPLPPETSPPAGDAAWPQRQPAAGGDAPWLTGSAYAHPNALTHEEPGRRPRAGWQGWLRRLLLVAIALIPIAILFIGGSVLWTARTAEPQQADAIVVMGAAQYNGRPSRVFEARLEYALDLYNDGYAPLIVVTGGKMPGDAFTEAETARAWFIDRGVPESAIVGEFEGRDTWQSMQGVATVLDGTGVKSLLIVSDGFHLLRAGLMARDLGFEASGAAAPDSPIRPWSGAELSYVIRETGGIIALVPVMLGLSATPLRT